MNVQHGNIVIVDYPYSDNTGSKVRPALVVQSDIWNQRLETTIIASITSSHRRRVRAATQYFIDIATADGQQTGLRLNSTVKCENLLTYNKNRILGVIGRLPDSAMQQVDVCLKAALGIQ